MYAQLRYYFRSVDLETLTDDAVLGLWQDLAWIRAEEKRQSEKKEQ